MTTHTTQTRRLAAALLIATLAPLLHAAPAEAADHILWRNEGTAYMTPPGRLEWDMFGSMRWGFREDMELSTDLLWNLAMPNVQLKKHWSTAGAWTFTSRHRASYPTLFYKLTSREGTGGFLPPANSGEIDIPQIIALENDLLITRKVGSQHLVTARAGVEVAPRFGGEPLPVIEFPLIYPRTASSMTWATWRAALQVDGQIWGPLDYHADARIYFLPAIPGGLAVEQRTRIAYRPSRTLAFELGYVFSRARYPYGARNHILPAFDFSFAWE